MDKSQIEAEIARLRREREDVKRDMRNRINYIQYNIDRTNKLLEEVYRNVLWFAFSTFVVGFFLALVIGRFLT